METLKKLLVVLLALTVVFCFAACGENNEETEPTLNPGDPGCEHVWSAWEVTKENSCTKNGRQERQCETCGKQEKEELLAYGHAYYGGVCSECEKEEKECEHPETYVVVMSQATCEQSGEERKVCKLCKGVVKYNYIDPYWHYDTETVTVAEPTCTDNGLEQEICQLCGIVVYEYTLWANGHQDTERVILVEATCTEDGLYQDICTLCGEVDYEGTLWSNGHEYEYIDSKAATCTEIGWKSYRKCTVCGYLYNYEERPATGHSYRFGNCTSCGIADTSFTMHDASGFTQNIMTVAKAEASVYSADTGFVSLSTGEIAEKNKTYQWTLTAPVDGRYFVWLSDIYSGYYIKMYVYNSLGERVTYDSSIYNREGLYMDLTAGTYTIELSYGSGLTTYNINVGFAKPSADISAYTQVNDQMEFTRQIIKYTFVPTVSGIHYFSLAEMTGNAEMYMAMYNRLNERVSYDSYVSNGEGLKVELVAGETYTLYIENAYGYLTNFILNIGKQQPTAIIDGYNYINDAMSFNHQVNYYQFTATKIDCRIDVVNMVSGAEVDIYLYNYLGERVSYATYCSNGEGLNTSKLVIGQTYTVKVIYRYLNTDYTLRVISPEADFAVTSNSGVTDTMEYGGQVNNYAYTATHDGEMVIYLRVDSYSYNRYLSIYVYDANGNKLGSDDYVYNGDTVTINNITAGTTYYVRVTSYGGEMIYALEFT